MGPDDENGNEPFDKWLDVLGGHNIPSNTASRDERWARELRLTILEDDRRTNAPEDELSIRREIDRLLVSAERQGSLGSTAAPRARWRPLLAVAAGITALSLAVILGSQLSQRSEFDVPPDRAVDGSEFISEFGVIDFSMDRAIRSYSKAVPDPRELAERLARELRASEVPHELVRTISGDYRLTWDASGKNIDAVRAAMDELSLDLQADEIGVLEISTGG